VGAGWVDGRCAHERAAAPCPAGHHRSAGDLLLRHGSAELSMDDRDHLNNVKQGLAGTRNGMFMK